MSSGQIPPASTEETPRNETFGNERSEAPGTPTAMDALGMRFFAKAPADFIRECDTPVRLAVCGERGTGKSSLMRLIEGELREEIISIWFDAAAPAIFDSGLRLPLYLLMRFVSELSAHSSNPSVGDAVSAKMRSLLLADEDYRSAAGHETPHGKADLGGALHASLDYISAASSLRGDIARLAAETLETTGRKKIVVFVDGLNDVEPFQVERALAVMKEFLACPGCVCCVEVDFEDLPQPEDIAPQWPRPRKLTDLFDIWIRVPLEALDLSACLAEILRRVGSRIPDTPPSLEHTANLVYWSVGARPRCLDRLGHALRFAKGLGRIGATTDGTDDDARLQAFVALWGMQAAFPDLYRSFVDAVRDGAPGEMRRVLSISRPANETAVPPGATERLRKFVEECVPILVPDESHAVSRRVEWAGQLIDALAVVSTGPPIVSSPPIKRVARFHMQPAEPATPPAPAPPVTPVTAVIDTPPRVHAPSPSPVGPPEPITATPPRPLSKSEKEPEVRVEQAVASQPAQGASVEATRTPTPAPAAPVKETPPPDRRVMPAGSVKPTPPAIPVSDQAGPAAEKIIAPSVSKAQSTPAPTMPHPAPAKPVEAPRPDEVKANTALESVAVVPAKPAEPDANHPETGADKASDEPRVSASPARLVDLEPEYEPTVELTTDKFPTMPAVTPAPGSAPAEEKSPAKPAAPSPPVATPVRQEQTAPEPAAAAIPPQLPPQRVAETPAPAPSPPEGTPIRMTEETHAPVVTAPPQPPQTTPEVEAPRASIQSGVVEESPPSLRYVETEEDYEPTIELNLDKLPETLPYGRSERAPHPSEPTPAKPEFAPPAEPPHIPLPKLASAHDDYEKTVRLEQHSFPSSSSFPSPPPHAPDPKAVESHAGPPLLPESKLKPPRPKKSINTAQVVKDIREGLTDDELMKRHELVPLQLKKLFRKLVEAKAMTLEEIENRKGKAA